MFPAVQSLGGKAPLDYAALEEAKSSEAFGKMVERVERLVSPTGYVAGSAAPTIADLLLYCEIGQLTHLGMTGSVLDDAPAVRQWMGAMAELPHHDDVHSSLGKVGDLLARKKARADKAAAKAAAAA